MTRITWGIATRIAALAFAIALPAGLAQSADGIGVTSAAQNHVEGVMNGQTTPLKVGSAVYQNQHVRTGAASTAQLLFRDQTSLSVGPSSDVTLDKFVYDPSRNTGDMVVSATRGAFRFVSGTQQPHNYQVHTPVATIGVRGTVVDGIVDEHKTTIILGECCADITLASCAPNNQDQQAPPPDQDNRRRNTECLFHLDVVGQGYTIFEDGRVDGPFVFDGSEHQGVGKTTFPLHVTQWAGTPHEPETDGVNGGPTENIDLTDLTTIQDNPPCVGEDCQCPDCGPGF